VLSVRPIATFAFSISVGKSWRTDIVSRKPANERRSDSGLFSLGTMETDTPASEDRLRITSVANRVHMLSLVGNGMQEMASKTELLPDD
jgi:hypothetical protein